jgi:hypothetical protein
VEAAVDVDHGAGAEREIAADECGHGLAHVFGRAPAALWHEAAGDQGVVLVGHARGHVGLHDARPHLVDVHALAGEPHRPEFAGHRQPCLGDAVVAAGDGGGVGGDRSHEHEGVAVRQAGRTLVGQPPAGGELGEEVWPAQVHADHLVEARLVGLRDVGPHPRGDAGVVDEAVEPAVGREHGVHAGLSRGGGGEFGRHRHEPLRFVAGGCPAQVGRLVGRGAVGGVVDGDVVAVPGESDRHAAAEAAAGAGDEDDRSGHTSKTSRRPRGPP